MGLADAEEAFRELSRTLERELAAAKAEIASLRQFNHGAALALSAARASGTQSGESMALEEAAVLRAALAAKHDAMDGAQETIEELRAEIGRLTSKGIGVEGIDTET